MRTVCLVPIALMWFLRYVISKCWKFVSWLKLWISVILHFWGFSLLFSLLLFLWLSLLSWQRVQCLVLGHLLSELHIRLIVLNLNFRPVQQISVKKNIISDESHINGSTHITSYPLLCIVSQSRKVV